MLDQLYKRFNVPPNIELMFNPDFKLVDIGGPAKVARFSRPRPAEIAVAAVELERFVF